MTNELKAFCTSRRCAGSDYKTLKITKDVPKTTTCCPDCGNVLLWKKERENRRYVSRCAKKLRDSQRDFL